MVFFKDRVEADNPLHFHAPLFAMVLAYDGNYDLARELRWRLENSLGCLRSEEQ